MIQSRGVLLKAPGETVLWSGTTREWPAGADLGFRWASYASIYSTHLWVATLVDKLAKATARLPLKVYEKAADNGRPEASGPYADLLARPNSRHDPYFFWLWTQSTLDIFGEVFWAKARDAGGRPSELLPMHPVHVQSETVQAGPNQWRTRWSYDNGTLRIPDIPRRDLVHFKAYNPNTLDRGLSPLEQLRSTLENEEGARKANSAMWRNGGRPSVILKHPGELSDKAKNALSVQWAEIHGGVDNWARAAILEEGMEATVLPLSAEDLQYVEARKLNREEVCARYDVPPPVVHILDRATFSNITEQMRSMYRDTMAPKLKLLESTLEFELRDGRMGDMSLEPDFGEGQYAEFLLDEVLRGDFEARMDAYQKSINSGTMQPAEARAKENLPFIPGSDVLLVNSTLVPLDSAGAPPSPPDPALAAPPEGHPMPADAMRSLIGRTSRAAKVHEIDPHHLAEGLNGHAAAVRGVWAQAVADGLTVPEFRERLKALGGTT